MNAPHAFYHSQHEEHEHRHRERKRQCSSVSRGPHELPPMTALTPGHYNHHQEERRHGMTTRPQTPSANRCVPLEGATSPNYPG
jgi:hypothetical protein